MANDMHGKPIEIGNAVYAVVQAQTPAGAFPFLDYLTVIGVQGDTVVCKLTEEQHVKVPAAILHVIEKAEQQ